MQKMITCNLCWTSVVGFLCPGLVIVIQRRCGRFNTQINMNVENGCKYPSTGFGVHEVQRYLLDASVKRGLLLLHLFVEQTEIRDGKCRSAMYNVRRF